MRFIKTIGDAVMLVSVEAAPLLEAMLALVETIDSDEALPQLRAGVSYGAAVSRAGAQSTMCRSSSVRSCSSSTVS